MNLSLFNIILGNQKYNHVINADKSIVIQEMKYFVDEKYTSEPWFIGEVCDKSFQLEKTKKMLKIPLDFSYRVLGEFEEKGTKCNINYRITFTDYFLKHISVCIIPTVLLIFIFKHYSLVYMLIPLIYLLISDFIFNIRKYFFSKRNSGYFKSFLITIEKRVKN